MTQNPSFIVLTSVPPRTPSLPTCVWILLLGRYHPLSSNQRHAPVDGETKTPHIPVFHPFDLVGRTFLIEGREDGQRHRACIVQAIADHASDLAANPTRIKFLCSINDEQFEEILTYNEVLHHIEQNEDDAVVWKFRRITAHEGPLKQSGQNGKDLLSM